MTRGTAYFVHAGALLAGGTGLVYAWMVYLAEPADELAIANHPLQADFQHLHLLVAPLLVFGCGILWRGHIWGRIRSGFPARRGTGLFLALALFPMIATGYLMQAAVEPAWRDGWRWSHTAVSCLWIGAYLAHQLRPRTQAAPETPAERKGGEPEPAEERAVHQGEPEERRTADLAR